MVSIVCLTASLDSVHGFLVSSVSAVSIVSGSVLRFCPWFIVWYLQCLWCSWCLPVSLVTSLVPAMSVESASVLGCCMVL